MGSTAFYRGKSCSGDHFRVETSHQRLSLSLDFDILIVVRFVDFVSLFSLFLTLRMYSFV